jgi:hypothetical protein
MQAKMPKLLDLSKIPVTFIHGNPHLDNYVRTARGSAMMDFDRSRMGLSLGHHQVFSESFSQA